MDQSLAEYIALQPPNRFKCPQVLRNEQESQQNKTKNALSNGGNPVEKPDEESYKSFIGYAQNSLHLIAPTNNMNNISLTTTPRLHNNMFNNKYNKNNYNNQFLNGKNYFEGSKIFYQNPSNHGQFGNFNTNYHDIGNPYAIHNRMVACCNQNFLSYPMINGAGFNNAYQNNNIDFNTIRGLNLNMNAMNPANLLYSYYLNLNALNILQNLGGAPNTSNELLKKAGGWFDSSVNKKRMETMTEDGMLLDQGPQLGVKAKKLLNLIGGSENHRNSIAFGFNNQQTTNTSNLNTNSGINANSENAFKGKSFATVLGLDMEDLELDSTSDYLYLIKHIYNNGINIEGKLNNNDEGANLIQKINH